MSYLRTSVLAGFLSFGLAAPQSADAALYDDPVTFFATCTGRLSAEMEFQWLIGAPSGDRTQAQRDAFIDILDALAPQDDIGTILHQRISAKMAHAALLQTAQFGTDPDQSARAADRAAKLVQACTNLVLS